MLSNHLGQKGVVKSGADWRKPSRFLLKLAAQMAPGRVRGGFRRAAVECAGRRERPWHWSAGSQAKQRRWRKGRRRVVLPKGGPGGGLLERRRWMLRLRMRDPL